MHDQNLKNLILDYPHQALAFFAADEFSKLDQMARVIPIRQERFDEDSPWVQKTSYRNL